MRILILALALLAGCANNPVVAECTAGTDVRFVDRIQYVEIDPALTMAVIDPDPGESETYGEAKTDADRRSRLLTACNTRLFEIRGVQGTRTE